MNDKAPRHGSLLDMDLSLRLKLGLRSAISTIAYVAIGFALASAMYRPVNQINVEGIRNTVLLSLR